MKVKFGWVVGVNVAAACLLMQGCKAVRPANGHDGNNVKTVETAPAVMPADDIQVTATPAPAPAPAPEVKPAPAVAPVPTAPAPAVEPAPAPAPAAEPAYTLYTVKPGDMLSKISKRYNIRQKAILDLNPGLSPNKLYAGKKIKLPGKVDVGEPAAAAPVAAAAAPATADSGLGCRLAAPAAADAASVKAPKAAKAVKYTGATKVIVVKSGDSLGKIAQENGTDVRTIKELNGLKDDRVFIGRKLKVPAEKTVKPFAKKSEAKAATAKKAEAKPEAKPEAKAAPKAEAKAKDEAKKADAAAPAAPAADTPAAETTAASTPAPVAESAPAPAAPAPAPAPAMETHVVKAGEDVVSIAISYGVSPSALMDANDLKSSEVKEGDVLKIPAKSAQ